MKWTRSKSNDINEYSTGYIGLRHYISMSHTSYNKHYWYTYSVNGERVSSGSFEAESWDDAEHIVIMKIRMDLSWNAELWNERLANFNKEVILNEALD